MLESEDGGLTGTAAGSLASLGTGELRWSLSREACGAEQLDTVLTVCTVGIIELSTKVCKVSQYPTRALLNAPTTALTLMNL